MKIAGTDWPVKSEAPAEPAPVVVATLSPVDKLRAIVEGRKLLTALSDPRVVLSLQQIALCILALLLLVVAVSVR